MREAILYLGEDGYWVAECPSLLMKRLKFKGKIRKEFQSNLSGKNKKCQKNLTNCRKCGIIYLELTPIIARLMMHN